MASGFVRKSVKGELSTCRHGRTLQIHFTYGFWTHSLEMDEWSGIYLLKSGM